MKPLPLPVASASRAAGQPGSKKVAPVAKTANWARLHMAKSLAAGLPGKRKISHAESVNKPVSTDTQI